MRSCCSPETVAKRPSSMHRHVDLDLRHGAIYRTQIHLCQENTTAVNSISPPTKFSSIPALRTTLPSIAGFGPSAIAAEYSRQRLHHGTGSASRASADSRWRIYRRGVWPDVSPLWQPRHHHSGRRPATGSHEDTDIARRGDKNSPRRWHRHSVSTQKLYSIRGDENKITLEMQTGGQPQAIEGTHLLIAIGRTPNTDDLDLARRWNRDR